MYAYILFFMDVPKYGCDVIQGYFMDWWVELGQWVRGQ